MKETTCLLAALFIFSTHSNAQSPSHPNGRRATSMERFGLVFGDPKKQKEIEIAEAKQRKAEDQRRLYYPRDSWRVIDGKTNRVDTRSWPGFWGVVSQSTQTGIIVDGHLGTDGNVNLKSTRFFVEGFPYKVPDGFNIKFNDAFFAVPSGLYDYTTVMGAPSRVLKLSYGMPIPPQPQKQPTPEAVAAAQKKKADALAEAEARTLECTHSKAQSGDAGAQYRLGLRYLSGDGVALDPQLAREWLAKAAAQGHTSASNRLAGLKK